MTNIVREPHSVSSLNAHSLLRLNCMFAPEHVLNTTFLQTYQMLGERLGLPTGSPDRPGTQHELQVQEYLDKNKRPTLIGRQLLAYYERLLDEESFDDPQKAANWLKRIYDTPVVCDNFAMTFGSDGVEQKMLGRLHVRDIQDGVLQRKRVTVSALGAVCVDPAAFDPSVYTTPDN